MATAPTELLSSAGERGDAFYWRWFVTALSFTTFGLGAILVGALILPAVRLAPGEPSAKRRRARAVLRVGLRAFIGLMHRTGGMTYEIRGFERLGRPGQLIVANHPTLIDVLFLIAFTPDANCVVKHALWRNPFTRHAVRLADYVSNVAAPEMIEGACSALREGQTLIMFPEGTRSRPGEPLEFHRGAANIALRAARCVTPVYIRCEPSTLAKHEPWHRIPPRRPHFSLVVGDDLPLEPFRDAPLPLASRRFNDALQGEFSAALARPGRASL